MIKILQAGEAHLETVVPLFDAYRVFYKQDSDLKSAETFLRDRMRHKQAVIFLASSADTAVGFTLLYPSFSSVSMEPVFILNDLYVNASFRKKGVGEALLNHAKEFCKKMNYKGLALETARDNPAQKLYERLGWEKDLHCFHYFWKAP